jgi:adenylylsulfate kinase
VDPGILAPVMPLPNITDIFYGRDVGYRIERIELDDAIEQVSATDLRKRIGGGRP